MDTTELALQGGQPLVEGGDGRLLGLAGSAAEVPDLADELDVAVNPFPHRRDVPQPLIRGRRRGVRRSQSCLHLEGSRGAGRGVRFQGHGSSLGPERRWREVPGTTRVTRHRVNRRGRRALQERHGPGWRLSLADGTLPAQRGPSPDLARLLVILALAQLPLEAAPLKQFLEAAQGRADRLPLVDPHPQWHAFSLENPPGKPGGHPLVRDGATDRMGGCQCSFISRPRAREWMWAAVKAGGDPTPSLDRPVEVVLEPSCPGKAAPLMLVIRTSTVSPANDPAPV